MSEVHLFFRKVERGTPSVRDNYYCLVPSDREDRFVDNSDDVSTRPLRFERKDENTGFKTVGSKHFANATYYIRRDVFFVGLEFSTERQIRTFTPSSRTAKPKTALRPVATTCDQSFCG